MIPDCGPSHIPSRVPSASRSGASASRPGGRAPDHGRGGHAGPAALLAAVLFAASLLPLPSPWAPATPVPGAAPLEAQVQAPERGSADLGLLLRRLDGEKRVLMVAAHPDDEDTSVLAALARGQGARAAYLSLSRGEGGQNLIGSELGEGLGIVRTGELLSARSLDGAEQYFGRAFDFGFSRSADETFEHWPEEELVRDVVWIVRTFRPHVIVSVFAGDDRDGHGQHQAAGVAAHRAFEAAGDPARFPDQLSGDVEPWEPLKLYRSARFRPEDATLEMDTGVLDPLLGRSHFQLAMESRSRHRSQDMGAPRTPGPRSAWLELAASRVPVGGDGTEGDDGIFAGIDTTLVGLARAAGAADESPLVGSVEAYRAALREARAGLLASEPDGVMPALLEAREALAPALRRARGLPVSAARRELVRVLEAREEGVAEAVLAAASVTVDVRVDRDRIVPGEEAEVQLFVWNGGPREVAVHELELAAPDGWEVAPADPPRAEETDPFRSFFALDPASLADVRPEDGAPAFVPAGDLRRWVFRVRVPGDAEVSRLYFLEDDRDGSLYRWPDDPGVRGQPGNPPLVRGRAVLGMGDGAARRDRPSTTEPGGPSSAVEAEKVDGDAALLPVTREATHVDVDRTTGEYRVPFFVLPALSVEVEPAAMAWPAEQTGSRPVNVRVTNHRGQEAEGELRLEAPDGWEVTPRSHPLRVGPGGGETAHRFEVRPGGAASGTEAARFRAVARVGERTYDEGVTLIDYPHLDPAPFHRDAELRVARFPVRVAPDLRVGYVMGPGDAGADALRDLGVDVEILEPRDLRTGALEDIDALVVGIRAYEAREELVAANDHVLDFARQGGTVVVQYNQYRYSDGGLAPYPVSIARPHDRVTQPDAPVTVLEPGHPLMTRPNRITDEDFDGWIQERGLYFLHEWDERYTPLLEMSDPGLEPNRGSLVVARVGEGAYVYTGLALFRQLPEGVPGAFRLLANLVSLRGADLGEADTGAAAGGDRP